MTDWILDQGQGGWVGSKSGRRMDGIAAGNGQINNADIVIFDGERSADADLYMLTKKATKRCTPLRLSLREKNIPQSHFRLEPA